MALFDKLFSLKRKLDDREIQNRGSSCQINPEQVRLLLFKECDRRGRKLLFDSSSIQKVPAVKSDKPNVRQNDVPCVVEVSHGFTYWYKGTATDVSILGEMTFGAVAMNYKNVSLKIHIMDEPRRLMCTKVFCVPSRRFSRVERCSDHHELNGSDLRDSSKPLSVPLVREEVALSFSLGRGDSGYYGDHSSYSSVGSDYYSVFDRSDSQDDFCYFRELSGRRLSTCSNGSWQRRTLQNMATRFDFGSSSLNLLSPSSASNLGNSSDSQMYCNSSASGTNESLGSTGSLGVHRKAKLGLALLISVADHNQIDLVRRCLEHSPQLQLLVARLRLATLTAGASSGFVSTLHRAAEDAAKWLSDLVYGPRLQSMWLNLVTSNIKNSSKLAESLLSDICQVLSVGDTKSTNFFISTLLTHILTYHLGWVATVSPYDTIDHQLRQDTSTHTRKPYNALWAQLSDLCGSIGFPPCASKTIISGANNTHFLNRLLVVITYFVRCGNVIHNQFQYENSMHKEIKVTNVMPKHVGLKRSATHVGKLEQCDMENRKITTVNTQNNDSSVSTLVTTDVSLMRSSTLVNLSEKLSNSSEFVHDYSSISEKPVAGLRRNPTMMILKASSESGINSSVSEEIEPKQKVLFVLGDDDKLVGLKNKSVDGKHVKKSSKTYESLSLNDKPKTLETCTIEGDDVKRAESPSKCCGQTLQHSKPIKHSGFKFEFEKYPQIVTNYMKSKNLEILDRHYIGKPGNLKLDNFQFDPMVVPPIQEEKCDACIKCQMMESMLQTPTNASEMEYMNDMPRQVELQYAKETIVDDDTNHWKMSPKTFVRHRKENTLVVNLNNSVMDDLKCVPPVNGIEVRKASREKDKGRDKTVEVKRVLEFAGVRLRGGPSAAQQPGFDASLLGGLTDHYVPDLILQGTTAKPSIWEEELRRDLNLASYLSKTMDTPTPIQAVAIIGDTNTWEVRVVGRDCGTSGMSSLVGAMLDALPAMRRARVPAHQCISFVEAKLRELCVLSKTLADMLMTTDFCDMDTLTKSLNIDVNDVPLLLAVATTHTPQVAARYGISYR